ncbi:alpha/beta hydrolase [Neobacillus drentensis]|uniref:alpha/beta hydrolase n=1 Tax=Neobacillus drentensis TaxID=220684 RepID=UPI0030032F83
MKQSKEYNVLVNLLKERTITEERDGMEVHLKQIPDSDHVGELDPRVFEVLNTPEQDFPDFGQLEMKDIPFDRLREVMGWPNQDITQTGIQTDFQTIEGENGSIPIRIYSPKEGSNLPAIVYFHGGGFFGGSVDTVENPCKAISEKAQAVVISVDYRLAPENLFPAGLTDCFDVVKWVYQNAETLNVNRNQLVVSGDSAGGNLATACALKDRDLGTKMIKLQALIYPVVDLAHTENEVYEWSLSKYEINNHQDLILRGLKQMRGSSDFLLQVYLGGQTDSVHPYASPLFADDLSGLPETLIVTAEYDALRLEAEAYAKKLKRFDVKTKLIQYNGMDHAFFDKIGQYPQAEDCVDEIVKAMRSLFQTGEVVLAD